jgi:YedE family putative selenium metabolism protein
MMRKFLARITGRKNLVAGLAMGLAGAGLAFLGNPRNTGICVSCFAENVAGSLRLHGDPRMTYLRPEFMGFLLGSTAMALGRGAFRPRGGSSPLIRFFAGFFLIVGSAVFLGCPIKVMLRLAAGDLSALSGLAGLIAGVWLGVLFLRRGFFLGRSRRTHPVTGWIMPAFMVLLTAGVFWGPPALRGGMVGAAAEHAPVLISLAAGGVVGALSQRSSFCVTGGLRNFFLTRDLSMVSGVGVLFLSALVFNLAVGLFQPGLYNQPGSHLDFGWGFAGMALVGFAAALIGGCPFRQLVLAGEGDGDAGAAVLGMLVGGGLVQSWALRSTLAGVTPGGKVATALGIVLLLAVAMAFRERE